MEDRRAREDTRETVRRVREAIRETVMEDRRAREDTRAIVRRAEVIRGTVMEDPRAREVTRAIATEGPRVRVPEETVLQRALIHPFRQSQPVTGQ